MHDTLLGRKDDFYIRAEQPWTLLTLHSRWASQNSITPNLRHLSRTRPNSQLTQLRIWIHTFHPNRGTRSRAIRPPNTRNVHHALILEPQPREQLLALHIVRVCEARKPIMNPSLFEVRHQRLARLTSEPFALMIHIEHEPDIWDERTLHIGEALDEYSNHADVLPIFAFVRKSDAWFPQGDKETPGRVPVETLVCSQEGNAGSLYGQGQGRLVEFGAQGPHLGTVWDKDSVGYMGVVVGIEAGKV